MAQKRPNKCPELPRDPNQKLKIIGKSSHVTVTYIIIPWMHRTIQYWELWCELISCLCDCQRWVSISDKQTWWHCVCFYCAFQYQEPERLVHLEDSDVLTSWYDTTPRVPSFFQCIYVFYQSNDALSFVQPNLSISTEDQRLWINAGFNMHIHPQGKNITKS